MDYSNERWIRVYTRDTTTWKVMDWRARSVLMLLLRKVTRSGVLDVGGRGARGLAAMIEMPLEVVTEGLKQLVEEGVVAETSSSYVLPKFIEAQEATTSDAQRSRDYRERQRDRELGETVTLRDAAVTSRDANVTRHHAPSPVVTLESTVEESKEREIAASPLSLSIPEAQTGQKRRRSRAPKPQVSLPSDWAPRDHEREKARALNLDPEREAEKFRNNALAKGHTYADWDAAFRTWLGNAPGFNSGRGPPWSAQSARPIRSIPTRQQREQEPDHS